jgi:acetate---CoA ligase (ADP-forming)
MDLTPLLRPRSIAVVGATERPGSYGGEALLNLRRLRFAGPVHGVNPRRELVHGFPCVPSIADLPEAPDAVVVAIPAAAAPEAVEAIGARGCGGAVVFAAGFAEAAPGAALQKRLAAAAEAHDLPVCGPNGNGIVSLHEGVALWGDMVAPREAGPVALVSQSGNLAVNALASRRGLRLHTVVSSGNEAVLGAADFVEAIAALDGVRAVAVYVEDEGDGERWCTALERCARAGIGVTILKAGLTAAGAAAAQAHTGALAGDGAAFRALADEAGAAWARDPHELLELAKALAVGRRGGARPGGGVAVMTCSGGDGSVAADLADELGPPLAALAPETVTALEAVLPAAATAANPLDYTSLLWEEPDTLRALVRTLAADPLVERLLVLYDEPDALEGAAAGTWAGVLEAVRQAAGEIDAPLAVASTLPELLTDEVAAGLLRDGIAAVAGLRTGLGVVAALRRPAARSGRLAELGRAAARARGARHSSALVWQSEHEAKALLRAAGVAVAEGRLARDADDAAALQARLGGPVAVKLTGPGLRHKTELGAVELGVETPAAAAAAHARLAALALDGAQVLVERMAPPGADLLVAARADGVVPTLVVGLGGVWTEALADVAVLALPTNAVRVEAALRGLRGAAVLTGARRGRALDLGAAARLAAAAGDLLLDEGLALLELNPVIVGAEGAIAVDALAAAPAPSAAPEPTTAGATP